jgi:hypothetical protein
MSKLDTLHRRLLSKQKVGPAIWVTLKPGEEVSVPVEVYRSDFQDMVRQLEEHAGVRHVRKIRVVAMPMEPFARWARNMKPDWDRYLYETARHLMERGRISLDDVDDFDRPRGKAIMKKAIKRAGLPEPYKLGQKIYIERLAGDMRKRKPLPPILMVNGRPMDGRHRVLAALTLGLKTVPVTEVVR